MCSIGPYKWETQSVSVSGCKHVSFYCKGRKSLSLMCWHPFLALQHLLMLLVKYEFILLRNLQYVALFIHLWVHWRKRQRKFKKKFSPATNQRSSSSGEWSVHLPVCKPAVRLLHGSCSHTGPRGPPYHWGLHTPSSPWCSLQILQQAADDQKSAAKNQRAWLSHSPVQQALLEVCWSVIWVGTVQGRQDRSQDFAMLWNRHMDRQTQCEREGEITKAVREQCRNVTWCCAGSKRANLNPFRAKNGSLH